MRYTRYKDKNGRPIHEGDTVKFEGYEARKVNWNGVVATVERDNNRRWILTSPNGGEYLTNLSEMHDLAEVISI